jgi:hypothetical protein
VKSSRSFLRPDETHSVARLKSLIKNDIEANTDHGKLEDINGNGVNVSVSEKSMKCTEQK